MVDWIGTTMLGVGLTFLIAAFLAAYLGNDNLGVALLIPGALGAALGARWLIENSGRDRRKTSRRTRTYRH